MDTAERGGAYDGRNILVIGAGRSGLASAEFLARRGARVILADQQEPARSETLDALKALGVECLWGGQPDVACLGVEEIVVSPGVPLSIPPLVYARAQGIPVTGELELAYRNCAAPFVAITGTNGKTTTTTLCGELLKKRWQPRGRRVLVGGNIGVPLIREVPYLTAEDVVVAEVSSFQLETTEQFRPHLALMLNLTPDHLDRHGDMEGYLAAKAKIFANQTAADALVLNYDDPRLRALEGRSGSRVIFFSQREKLTEGVYLDGERVMLALDGAETAICRAGEIAIRGRHNLENAMGAIALAFLSGVAPEDIRQVLMEFPGVEHRLEPVRTLHGVLYINDSKGTNPDSTVKALEACDRPVVLILGGKNKGSDFTELARLVRQRVKAAVVLGEARETIAAALRQAGFEQFVEKETFDEAVAAAAAAAVPGDIVLLSPACASWDMFSNFEERGRRFKELVGAMN